MNFLQEYLEYSKIKKGLYNQNRNPRIWLFGEWFGEKCIDNCFFLANYVANNYEEIDVYWIAKEHTDTSLLSKKVCVVAMETEKAKNLIKIAGVAIMSQGFLDFSNKEVNCFGGGITLNLWHGIPWKHIAHDCSRYKNNILFKIYCRMVDSYRAANFYIATSDCYSDICQSAFGVKVDQIVKTGLPRNSIFYSSQWIADSKIEILKQVKQITGKEYGDNTRIVTYMPTFRDNTNEVFNFESIDSDFKEWLVKNDIIIIQKAHFVTYQRKKVNGQDSQNGNMRIVNMDNVIPQYLLAATDLLVTDYSGCFFDFLILDRPIIHFLYDYEYYLNDDRGLYYKKEEVVCGDVAFEFEELKELIKKNLQYPERNTELRKIRKDKFITYENEKSCEEITQFLIQKLNIQVEV